MERKGLLPDPEGARLPISDGSGRLASSRISPPPSNWYMLGGGKDFSDTDVGLAQTTPTPYPTKERLGGGHINSPRANADSAPRLRSSSMDKLQGGYDDPHGLKHNTTPSPSKIESGGGTSVPLVRKRLSTPLEPAFILPELSGASSTARSSTRGGPGPALVRGRTIAHPPITP